MPEYPRIANKAAGIHQTTFQDAKINMIDDTLNCPSLWQPPPPLLPRLEANTLHLWRADLDRFAEQLPTLENTLSDDEKTRANRFKFPIHRQRFIAARGILRHLLTRYLNRAPENIQFNYNAHGKPELPSAAIQFNLSHSNQWALFAFTSTARIGVDIEHIRPDIEAMEIAQRFFSTFENQRLEQTTDPAKVAAFFQTWTCKEAFVKAIGAGFSLPLTSFDVDIDGPRLVDIRGVKTSSEHWTLIKTTPTTDYVAAIAVEAKPTKLFFWDIAP